MRRITRIALASLALAACSKAKAPPAQSGSGSAPAPAVLASDAAIAVAADAAVDAIAAVASRGPCTVEDIKAARKTADAHVKARAYDKAIALLETVCASADTPSKDIDEQIAWAQSDLTFAFYKAGRVEDCFELALTRASAWQDVFPFDAKVIKALEYNGELCHKAAKQKRGEFSGAVRCANDQGYELPDGSCLLLGGTREEGADGEKRCKVVRAAKGGTRDELTVEGEGANVVDGELCCNINEVGVQERHGGIAILVEAGGRPCSDGKANLVSEHVYSVQGKKLVLEHKLDAIVHEVIDYEGRFDEP